MTSAKTVDLPELEAEYARLNAAKTVSDERSSLFSTVRVGPLTVTVDPARDAPYYNRVLGLSPATLPWLPEALGAAAGVRRVDVKDPVSGPIEDSLRERDFAPGERIVWLLGVTRAAPTGPVIRLRPDDCDRLLPLLQLEGSIDPALWGRRRRHIGTDAFRVFAVELEGRLVSMATTFVGHSGAILGNAVTLPPFRGRGLHRALIDARLADARGLGLEWVVTDVEPGTASLRNCERAGFTPLCEQSVWVRGRDRRGTEGRLLP